MKRVFVLASFVLFAASPLLFPAAGPTVDAAADWPVSLVDVAREAGLVHPSVYGGVERKRFIVETNGAGVAFLDYDNDGWLDALVLSGTRLEEGGRRSSGSPTARPPRTALPGRGDGTFRDVTARVGLRRHGWASSVCAATTTTTGGWTSS